MNWMRANQPGFTLLFDGGLGFIGFRTAIQFAKVGDKVLHQWHCDDLMFGILINNCFVSDGVKQKVQVIDNRGCPLDPILITGIRYSADLQRAYAESQVFKFADRPGVWFFCQIQVL